MKQYRVREWCVRWLEPAAFWTVVVLCATVVYVLVFNAITGGWPW